MPTIPYVVQTWTDGSGSTPLSAARMGVLESGIFNLSYAPTVRVYRTAVFTKCPTAPRDRRARTTELASRPFSLA
jgi:hypothetical protein